MPSFGAMAVNHTIAILSDLTDIYESTATTSGGIAGSVYADTSTAVILLSERTLNLPFSYGTASSTGIIRNWIQLYTGNVRRFC